MNINPSSAGRIASSHFMARSPDQNCAVGICWRHERHYLSFGRWIGQVEYIGLFLLRTKDVVWLTNAVTAIFFFYVSTLALKFECKFLHFKYFIDNLHYPFLPEFGGDKRAASSATSANIGCSTFPNRKKLHRRPSCHTTSPRWHCPIKTELHYICSQGPLAPVKPMSGRQKMQKQRFQYPLNFDNNRWLEFCIWTTFYRRMPKLIPITRSAYYFHQCAHRTNVATWVEIWYALFRWEPYNKSANARKRIAVTNGEAATDKKFFSALIKPSPGAANKVKLSHMANSGDLGQGSAFRSLPVYRVSISKETVILFG